MKDKGYNLYLRQKQTLDAFNINTPLRLAYFFARCHAESNLLPKRESLHYKSIAKARAAFYSPFKNKSDDFIRQYLFNSEKMANYVYANRGGNGNEASGDGFKYRGGAILQITFFDNILKLSLDTGMDYLEHPELLEDEFYSMIAACWFWKKNNINKYADADNLDAVCDMVNKGKLTPKIIGDSNGYEETKQWLKHYKMIFK